MNDTRPVTRRRIRIVRDDDYAPEGSNGKPLPEPESHYTDNPITPGGGVALTYAEYLTYYGDPDCHVGAGVVLDVMTPEDRDWRHAGSLWGIDLMYDDADVGLLDQTFYSVEEMPESYLKTVAEELVAEVPV